MKTRPADKRRRAGIARNVREFVGAHEIAPGEAWVVKDAGRTLAALFGKEVMQRLRERRARTLKNQKP